MFEIKTGDIFDYMAQGYALCHQCNCISPDVAGLAAAVYQKYPEADTRGGAMNTGLFGRNTIVKVADGHVVNMFAQLYPGRAGNLKDSEQVRLEAFGDCLGFLATNKTVKLKKFAFPHVIGCGLAGGDPAKYIAAIKAFAREGNFDVIMVKKG